MSSPPARLRPTSSRARVARVVHSTRGLDRASRADRQTRSNFVSAVSSDRVSATATNDGAVDATSTSCATATDAARVSTGPSTATACATATAGACDAPRDADGDRRQQPTTAAGYRTDAAGACSGSARGRSYKSARADSDG